MQLCTQLNFIFLKKIKMIIKKVFIVSHFFFYKKKNVDRYEIYLFNDENFYQYYNYMLS